MIKNAFRVPLVVIQRCRLPLVLAAAAATTTTTTTTTQTRNLAYLGALLVEGSITGIVYRTGDDTVMGELTKTVTSTPVGKTTLHIEVQSFANKIVVISCGIGLLVLIYWLTYLRGEHYAFMNLASMLVNVISVVVCFVPEGMVDLQEEGGGSGSSLSIASI